MTAFLLDTSVLAELTKRRPDENVMGWLNSNYPRTWLSAITLGELIEAAYRLGQTDKEHGNALLGWIEELRYQYRNKTLAVDDAVSVRWAYLRHARKLPPLHGLIAATAEEHGLTLATRDVHFFEGTGIHVVNPFELQ